MFIITLFALANVVSVYTRLNEESQFIHQNGKNCLSLYLNIFEVKRAVEYNLDNFY